MWEVACTQKCYLTALNIFPLTKCKLFCRCLNQCTYCKTKHARGELGSYPPDEIVARAKQSFEGKYRRSMSVQSQHRVGKKEIQTIHPLQ